MPATCQGLRKLFGGMATALAVATLSLSARAQTPESAPPPAAGKAAARTEREVPVVRLNFVSAPWQQVLQHVADETSSTLVIHDAPSGRFSRRDFRRHTRSEAVQILNQSLEPLGYRILETDKFLTVMQVQRARFEYPRRTVQHADAESTTAADPAEAVDDAAAPDAGEAPRRIRPGGRPKSVRSEVRQTGFDEEQPQAPHDTATAASEQTATQPPTQAPPAKSEPLERVTIDPAQPVNDLAHQIYTAFGDRAEVVPTTPEQLPAFRVFRQVEAAAGGVTRQPWFVLEMDKAANQLHVQASGKIAASVAALIRKLDGIPPTSGEAVRLVPDAEQAAVLAQQLDTQLTALRRQQQHADRQSLTLAQADAPTNDTAPANPPGMEVGQPLPPAGDQAQPPGGDANSVLGNLRGDVSVDALSDLDLLILRGNERDVEAVMEVIKVIERMAIGASPGIEILFLQSVDSEALATLLNDVYTRLSTLSTGTAASARQTRSVNIVAVGSPNAVLILAPQNTIDSVVDLASKLDRPQPPGSEVEVFFLRNAVASQVVTLLEGFYEDRPGLGTNIRVIADARTNSIVVNGSPKELAEVTKLIREIDTKQTQAAAQVRVIPLKSALATDLAQFLNTVIQGVINPPTTGAGGAGGAILPAGGAGGAAGGTQALRAAKAMVLEFLTNDGAAQRMIRSGALTDVRIAGDARSNQLTVTAPEESMALLVELITILDQPTSAVADIKAFRLERADATVVAELLQSLFPVTQQGQPAVQLSGADGFGSALIPLRVSVDPRTNTVVVVGNPDIIRMVEAILFTIDTESARNRKIEVLRLRNSPVADVATAINQYLQSQREILQIDPTRFSTTEILDQEVIVTAEPISNNLIISATPRFMEQILALAKKLDREPPQVVISSLIVEVTLEDTDEFGIELGFQDPVLFNRSNKDAPTTISVTNTSPNGVATTTQQIISQTATPGFLFNNAQLGNNVGLNTTQVGKQSLTNFALGRINNSLGFGGLVLSASSESVSALLRALAFHRNVQVLSNPKVLALDNIEAQIQQGQQVPIVNGVTIGATGLANPNIQQQQSGIILTVTPRISADGQIVMNVIVEKSQFDLNNGVPVFTDATNGNVITSPIKNVTNAYTTAKVQDGQTIVIGGLITKSEDVSEAKVPYLGDIPILGNAFRYDSRVFRRTELLIFLTPRVVHGDADVELIKQVEMERLHFFEDDAEMMYGPIMGVPAEEVVPLGESLPLEHGLVVPGGQPAPMTPTPQGADAAGNLVPQRRPPTPAPGAEAAPALPPAESQIPQPPKPSPGIPRLFRQ